MGALWRHLLVTGEYKGSWDLPGTAPEFPLEDEGTECTVLWGMLSNALHENDGGKKGRQPNESTIP